MEEKEELAKEIVKDGEITLNDLSPDELVEIIRQTRSEAKQRRLKERELEDKLAGIEIEKSKQDQAKKIAEGKKDEVIQDLTKQLEELKPKATEWDSYNKSKRDTIKDVLKDNWIDSFNLMPLSDLEKLASKFKPGESLLDSDNGSKKKGSLTKIEGLKKDYQLAEQRKDLKAQLAISRLIDEEEKKTKGQ